MIKSILLAIDGSSYTDSVIHAGIYFAKKLKAHLKVLSVIDVRPYDWQAAVGSESIVPIIPTASGSEESQETKKLAIEKMLAETEVLLKKEKITYSTEMPCGLPVDLICDQSRVADLVILGTRGEYRVWHEEMIGATLGPVSRQIERPLLVVGEKFEAVKHVLIAYDGSSAAAKALSLAGYLGSQLKVQVTLLVSGENEDEAASLMQEARDYLKTYNVNCQCVLESGSAAQKICEYSKENQIDLVVMGAYGHSRIYEILLGCTTEKVLKNSEIPVLLVR